MPLESISLAEKRQQSDLLKLAKLEADVKRMRGIRWLRSYAKIRNEVCLPYFENL